MGKETRKGGIPILRPVRLYVVRHDQLIRAPLPINQWIADALERG